MTADPWAGILDDNESIVWQGQPAPGVRFKIQNAVSLIFGLCFAGFALFWMIMASMVGGVFWMFGLLHFAVGLSLAFGPFVWPMIMANRTWYTLTDRRTFIATKNLLGQKSLASYPITQHTAITRVSHSFDQGSIHFATQHRRRKNRSFTVDIGFEDIADVDRVYRLMRDTQKAPMQGMQT